MKTLVALSAIGRDRPGIVAALSRVLFEKGCNLEDSSMTRLKGDFAVLLLLSLPPGLNPEGLRAGLEPVAGEWGLTFSLRALSGAEASGDAPAALPFTLVVYGVDHPGIVYRVTQAAADLKINITDLRTRVTAGSRAPLYSLVVEVDVPDASLQPFRKELERLREELKVEITLNAAEADEL